MSSKSFEDNFSMYTWIHTQANTFSQCQHQNAIRIVHDPGVQTGSVQAEGTDIVHMDPCDTVKLECITMTGFISMITKIGIP